MEEKRVKSVDFESQLERFRHIQCTLAMIYGDSEGDVDLMNTANDCVLLGDDGSMSIESIPLKGDTVTLNVSGLEDDGSSAMLTKAVPLSVFSAGVVSKVLNVMHRALIVEEIRNHVEY